MVRVRKASSEVGGATNYKGSLPVTDNGQLTATTDDRGGHVVKRELSLGGDLLDEVEDTCELILEIIVWWRARPFARRLQDDSSAELNKIALDVTISDPVNGDIVYPVIASAPYDGMATAKVSLTEASQLNDDDTGICDECTLRFVAGECLSGNACSFYDMIATNANMGVNSAVSDCCLKCRPASLKLPSRNHL